MSRGDDEMVYDGRFGWIDPSPEGFLPSIGVSVRESGNSLIYHIDVHGYRCTMAISRESDWHVLRAVIDDAEDRSTGRVSS
jgi:hypothetical protein